MKGYEEYSDLRKFDGQEYILYGVYKTKREAKKDAQNFRKQKFCCRVIKSAVGWMLYRI